MVPRRAAIANQAKPTVVLDMCTIASLRSNALFLRKFSLAKTKGDRL